MLWMARDSNTITSEPAPHADFCFERDEPSRPSQELARPAVVIELPQKSEKRIVRRLRGQVVDIASWKRRQRRNALTHVELGFSLEALVEVFDGIRPHRCAPVQAMPPGL
jgi:hypothetical protein